MRSERERPAEDPRLERAVAELSERIKAEYPTTSFAVQQGIDDPVETWLVATVDVEDPDEIIDLVVDRLLELQIDEEMPLHVLPVHTPERIAATRRRIQRPWQEPKAAHFPPLS